MKVKLHIFLNNEICINTQFQNTLTNFIKSEISTQIFVLLSIVWARNGLLFAKQLHMMI